MFLYWDHETLRKEQHPRLAVIGHIPHRLAESRNHRYLVKSRVHRHISFLGALFCRDRRQGGGARYHRSIKELRGAASGPTVP
jgi:hypothetical protein